MADSAAPAQSDASPAASNGQPSRAADGQDAAARLLQRRFRGHQSSREASGLNLSHPRGRGAQSESRPKLDAGDHQSQAQPTDRWDEALKSHDLDNARKDANEGRNDAASRWQRGGMYAQRLTGGEAGQDGEDPVADGSIGPNEKMLEPGYWLEIVDYKCGSNLKHYHAYWNEHCDSDESFFHWLDHGAGRELDLKECSRDQLEKECITFLNADQRKNYLVQIVDGKLVWDRNGKPVDTSKRKHKDAGNGRGIVDIEDDDDGPGPGSDSSSEYSSSDSSIGEQDPNRDAHEHYGGHRAAGQSKARYLTSPNVIMDAMLRKTTAKNVWIWVCSLKYELYVGIKQTGTFQHSSFLYGSRVRAAGLLKVKDGQLFSLSPLSGHYRAGTSQFKGFVRHLNEVGCDMSKVSISKSLAMIGAIEKYGAATKKRKSLAGKLKRKLHLTKSGDSDEEARKQEEEVRRRIMSEEQPTTPSKPCAKDEPIPHQGKAKEDMTEKERTERALALIKHAFAQGRQSKSEDDTGDSGQAQAEPAKPQA